MANTLKFGNGEWYGKKDTILAYNDENSNYKPLPFDFSRASSATVVNEDGLIETVGIGEPRIDYKDDTNGALLLEPQRTNLFTYSEDFSNSYWTKTNASVIKNSIVSPDGTLNGTKLTATSTGAILESNQTLSIGNTFTVSAFVKKGTNKFVRLAYSSSSETGAWFNLEDKTVGTVNSTSASIEDYGNGWFRIISTFNSQIASGGVFVGLSNTDGATNDSVANSTLYLWGAQIEQGSYSTSLIPTQGSAVTRLAESCSQTTPSGVIGQTEGTIFVDVPNLGGETNGYILEISDNSNTNRIIIQRDSVSDYRLYAQSSSGQQLNLPLGGSFIGNTKIAFTYANNDYNVYANGVSYLSGTSFNVPNCSKINIGGRYNNSEQLGGGINQAKLYSTRLSNSELASLTQV